MATAFSLNKLKSIVLVQKKCLAASILCALIFTVMPSTRTVVAMVVLPPIANNEHIQALPEDIIKFVRGFIHEHTPLKEKDKRQ